MNSPAPKFLTNTPTPRIIKDEDFHDLATAIAPREPPPPDEPISAIVERDINALTSQYDKYLEAARTLFEQVEAILAAAGAAKASMLQSRKIFCDQGTEPKS